MKKPGPQQQPPTSAWSMYRAIVGIGTLCALLIVGVYQATAGRIRNNQQRFLDQAIAEVLPAAKATLGVALSAQGDLIPAGDTVSLPAYLGYGASDELVGAVITAEGMGYQDTIRVLYAYSFDLNAIVGIKVLDSKETPGLGDRVEKEPHYLASFKQLDVTVTADGNALLHPIVTVKQGEKTRPWQIDGITGATITSEAIGTLLNDSAQQWIPVLKRSAHNYSLGKEEGAPDGR